MNGTQYIENMKVYFNYNKSMKEYKRLAKKHAASVIRYVSKQHYYTTEQEPLNIYNLWAKDGVALWSFSYMYEAFEF